MRSRAPWYIADYSAMQRNRGSFERWELLPHQLTYGTSPHSPGIGPNPVENSGVPLPQNETVSAFELYMSKNFNRVRIDDFALLDSTLSGTFRFDTAYEKCSV